MANAVHPLLMSCSSGKLGASHHCMVPACLADTAVCLGTPVYSGLCMCTQTIAQREKLEVEEEERAEKEKARLKERRVR